MRLKEYLLFDLDGTLTDPFEGITHSVQHALAHYGIIETDLRKLTPFIGPPLVDSFRQMYHFSEQQAEEAVAYYREYFADKGWRENQVYPGIRELLAQQREWGRRLYVATSKPTLFATRILEHFGLSAYFDRIGGASLDRSCITKTDVMRRLLQQAGIADLSRAVMVGDRKFDVEGAHAVGMECIGVLYGYGSEVELTEAGADGIARTVEELAAMLQA